MKICFVHSEASLMHEELITNIIDSLKENRDNQQTIIEKVQCKNTRKKYDLYVIIAESIEEFDENYTKMKCLNNVVLITSNLTDAYIKYTLNKVRDVIYIKNNIDTIVKRINHIIKRYKCQNI